MDDRNQAQPPRQPQPEDQPSSTSLPHDEEIQPTPFVPDEYEPATERPSFATPPAAFGSASTELSNPDTVPTTGQQPTPKKKGRKGLVITIIAVVLVVLLAGGAAAAYKFWYQNPQKVISDAMTNVVKAKSLTYTGNLSVEYDGGKIAIDMDGANPNLTSGQLNVKATITYQGKDYKVNGAGMVDKDGNFYVKLTNIRDIFDSLTKQLGVTTHAFDDFITKTDDKWIKISSDDIDNLDKDANTTKECVMGVLNKFNDDKTAKQELADVYKKHPFVNSVNDLDSQSINGMDSMGYTITLDKDKEKAFADDVRNTQLAKDLRNCDKNATADSGDTSDTSTDSKTSVQVWVSRWSHELTQIKLDTTTDGNHDSFTFDPVFNKPVTLETPKDALTLQDLQDELSKAMSAYETEALGGSDLNDTTPVTPQA